MIEPNKIEYRVRPVTRYVVTRYEETGNGSGSVTKGEYDSEAVAQEVGYALCRDEHRRLGWEPGDERIRYPEIAADVSGGVSRPAAA